MIGLCVCCVIGSGCSRARAPDVLVRGLTSDGYFRLSGAWGRNKDAPTEPGTFSWGRSPWVPNGSLIIDLGDSPPFLATTGILFEVSSVSELANRVYILNMLWKRSEVPDQSIRLVVHIGEDGSMWLEPNGVMGQGEGYPFYKVGGPASRR